MKLLLLFWDLDPTWRQASTHTSLKRKIWTKKEKYKLWTGIVEDGEKGGAPICLHKRIEFKQIVYKIMGTLKRGRATLHQITAVHHIHKYIQINITNNTIFHRYTAWTCPRSSLFLLQTHSLLYQVQEKQVGVLNHFLVHRMWYTSEVNRVSSFKYIFLDRYTSYLSQ